jgi:nucleotide-binding universal stress UspA family protein/CBS domain-containing protein
MKVLIATDSSDCAKNALVAATRLLPLASCEVIVLSIAPFPSPFMLAPGGTMDMTPVMTYEQLMELTHAQAKEALNEAKAQLGEAGQRATYLENEGDPAEHILDAATEREADLIVMGSHGRGALGRMFLGSVSAAVMHRWQGAVMVIREGRACGEPTQQAIKFVREAMTEHLVVATTDMTLQHAARLMADADVGALPVLDAGCLVGIITDRDITVRATAKGLAPATTTVAKLCSPDLATATPDMPVSEAVKLMEQRRIRRLPVVSDGQLVGMVALGDLAECSPLRAEEVLVEISKSPSTLAHTARPR